jgi:hypothetical protein
MSVDMVHLPMIHSLNGEYLGIPQRAWWTDGITTKKLDDHGDQEVVLKLSQWLMLWNILRSLMVLALRMSMTMESSELC